MKDGWLDPKAEVLVASDNFELMGSLIPLSSVNPYNEGSKEIRTFVDAFDGDTYEKEVYSIFDGNIKVVRIS